MDTESFYSEPVEPTPMPQPKVKKKRGFGFGLVAGILVTLVAGFIGTALYTRISGNYLVLGKQKVGVTGHSYVMNQETLDRVEELIAYMDLYYYDQYDAKAIQDAIYEGTLSGLNDPYSVYYTADEYADLQVTTTGTYYGIGAGLSQNVKTMEVTVTKVYAGTPSEEAGLRNGDMILMVDDIEATSMELTNLVKKIRGEEGTTVHLTIYRESEKKTLEMDVMRRNVELPSVEGQLLGDSIGYVQISEFQSKTAKQFEQMIADLKEEGMQGLVVDLRGNPGGLVSAVVKILDDILPEGTVVYTEDKYGNRDTYSSDSSCYTYPLVVLIDQNSASAAEIFAGAIKDYDYGELIGTTSFGKGIVQTIFPLKDGAAVKITTAKYFTPKGNNIHGIGITPDQEIAYEYSGPMDEPYEMQYDNQLQAALECMRGKLAE